MIHIDFYPGAHGNYLEFVCNKIAGVAVGLPFNSLGASHNKNYVGEKMFNAHHYSYGPTPVEFEFDKIISIQLDKNDLLSFCQGLLLRGGDYGYDNNQLEIDTYNKFNTIKHRWALDMIIQNFFTNQVRDSYNAVRDPSWPDVTTIEEFEQLPESIKKECIEQHKLELLELSPERPDCPRSVLREFFQIGFQSGDQHGMLIRQNQLEYNESAQLYVFPFWLFYNKTNFLREIEKVAAWAGIAYNCQQDIEQLHDEFLKRQPYKNSKNKCDTIIMQIQNNKVNLPTVDLLEEAYINAKLGWNYFV